MEPSTGWVDYGISPEQLSSKARSKAGGQKPKTKHSVRLKRLKSMTAYYYQVTVVVDGKSFTTPTESFTTPR
jgi:hypothetical protein